MEPLDSGFVRPRQARYQAALRPDMQCTLDSKALSNFTATPLRHLSLDCAKIVPNTLMETFPCRNPGPLHRRDGKTCAANPAPRSCRSRVG